MRTTRTTQTTLIRQLLVAFAFLPIPNRLHVRSFAFLCIVHTSSLTDAEIQVEIANIMSVKSVFFVDGGQ